MLNYKICGKEMGLIRFLHNLTYADVGHIIGKSITWVSFVEKKDNELSVSDSNKLFRELGIDEESYISIKLFLSDMQRKIKR